MTRRLLHATIGSLIAIAIASPGVALADLTIKSPSDGSLINDSTPKFRGTAYSLDELEELFEEVFGEVTVKISGGDGGAHTLPPATLDGANWSVLADEPLQNGTYTAQATQGTRTSNKVTFTVDATPPAITMTTPTSGSFSGGTSQPVGGAAGTADGDLPAITVQLFAGEAVGPQAPLEALVVQASEGAWSATLGGLGPGTYTAQATQRDQAGNVGSSAPVTFTILAPPAAPPPVASFSWLPQRPAVGESVSLVSSSTDPASPITGFEWSLSADGAFSAGKPVLSTSFATPGGHVVRLRVTDAAGRSSIATETVPVSARPRVLMQPFPIVRIAGSVTSRGARLRLVTVQAPVGSRVTVACRGPGCKAKSESRLATASSKSKDTRGSGAVLLSFHRFERTLRAGAILKVLVSKSGEIGKYTSLAIRRHRLPVRRDACLASASSTPIPCPTS